MPTTLTFIEPSRQRSIGKYTNHVGASGIIFSHKCHSAPLKLLPYLYAIPPATQF